MGQGSNLSVKINVILSHVFRRPYLSISPDTPFGQLGTYLATGHQVHVDGLIVASDKKVVGMIGGKQILDNILEMKYEDWLKVSASQIMISDASSVELDSSLGDLLKLFETTRFGFAPITNRGNLIGSIGIRDLLQLAFESNLRTPVAAIESPIIRLKPDESLRSSIETMLKRNIRNLVFSGGNLPHNDNADYIVNDRKILEFIFSYEGTKIMDKGIGSAALDNVDINSLDMIPASYISETNTVSKAAKLLSDTNIPGLLSENNIITPWDVVMKTLPKEYSNQD